MKRISSGILLSALAVFVWGALYWSSPFPFRVTGRCTDDEAAGAMLKEYFPETGSYLVPGQYNDRETTTRLMEAGPLAMVHIRHEGMPPMQPGYLIRGFIHILAFTALGALLMKMVSGSLPTYSSRVRFMALAGLVSIVFMTFTDPVWYSHPWGWYLVTALYLFVAWVIAGAVLGAFMGSGADAHGGARKAVEDG